MKTLKLNAILIIPIIVLLASGCKKQHEVEVIPPQNVMTEFLGGYFDPITSHVTGAQDYSVGYQFVPKKDGSITQVGVNFPKVGNYKVSLWDVESASLITEVTLQQPNGNWASKDITEIPLVAQKTYAICFWLPANSEYHMAADVTMPVIVDDITITSSVASYGDTFPVDIIHDDKFFGFLDFTFQAKDQ